MRRQTHAYRFVAALAIAVIAVPPAQIAAMTARPAPPRQAAGTTPPAAPRPATAQPAAPAPAAPLDGGWPRMYDLSSGGSILMYQPQISSWPNQKHVVAFSAISYRDKGASKPAFGTIRLEADTKVSVSDRLVQFEKLKIVEANFQALSKEQVNTITSAIE